MLLPSALLVALTSCHTLPPELVRPSRPIDEELLTSGTLLFDTAVDAREVSSIEPLAVDDEMRAFVAATQRGGRMRRAERLRRLIDRLTETGYLETVYAAEGTADAIRTFHSRTGNCLSFTNLFVALAREAGLDARFQIVDVPPAWDFESDLFIRSNHVNAVVRQVRSKRYPQGELVVDLNAVLPSEEFDRHIISDVHAESMVYANLAIEELRDARTRRAVAYLQRALKLMPENADYWTNLGVIYSKAGHLQAALDIFGHALVLEPDSDSALAGLAHVYAKTGDTEKARRLQQEVTRRRNRDPFYHYAVARSAYERNEFATALDAINAALRRQSHTGAFHLIKALIEFRMGDDASASKSFTKAVRFGGIRDLAENYSSDIRQMQSQQGDEPTG